MKTRRIFAWALALLLVLSACGQSEQDKKFDELTKKSSSAEELSVPEPESSPESSPESDPESSEAEPTPEPTPYVDPEGLTGEFTIKCAADTGTATQKSTVEALADEFMALHPGVTIHMDYTGSIFDNQSREERLEQYMTRVLAELGSGEADYLLYSPPSQLDVYGLSQSGIFMDLRPYFDSDPSIDPDDYYTQALDALSVDGKLTLMPFAFEFNGIMLNRPLMEKLDVDLEGLEAINYKMLLDWYDQAKALDPDVQATFGAWTQDSLYGYEAPDYIDLENNTASYDSPEFVEFLTRTGALEESDKEMPRSGRSIASHPEMVEWVMRMWETGEEPDRQFGTPYEQELFDYAHEGVAVPVGVTGETLGFYSSPLEYLAGPYPAVSSNGLLGISSSGDFAIPSSMKNLDLAWRFISYCISEREEMTVGAGAGMDYYTVSIPINKKNFVHLQEFLRTSSIAYQFSNSSGFDKTAIDPEKGAQKLEEYLSMPLVDMKTHVIDMSEYLDEFYDNKLTTPEQCAEKIQGRAYIWLNE